MTQTVATAARLCEHITNNPSKSARCKDAERRIALAQSLCDRAGVWAGPGEVFSEGNDRIAPIVGALPSVPATGRWAQVRTFGHQPFGWVTITGTGLEPLAVDVSTPAGERAAMARLRELWRPMAWDHGWRRIAWSLWDAIKHA